jgi:hypothetical protein
MTTKPKRDEKDERIERIRTLLTRTLPCLKYGMERSTEIDSIRRMKELIDEIEKEL